MATAKINPGLESMLTHMDAKLKTEKDTHRD